MKPWIVKGLDGKLVVRCDVFSVLTVFEPGCSGGNDDEVINDNDDNISVASW